LSRRIDPASTNLAVRDEPTITKGGRIAAGFASWRRDGHSGRRRLRIRTQHISVAMTDSQRIIVTTVDIRGDYEVLGQVYVQVANRGEFSSHLQFLREQYASEIDDAIARGQIGQWSPMSNDDSGGQIDFEHAFYIATRELQKRAALMGADAVVGMRQDIDLDAEVSIYFFLQMYGTAVRFKG
jgi:hypothetical protein